VAIGVRAIIGVRVGILTPQTGIRIMGSTPTTTTAPRSFLSAVLHTIPTPVLDRICPHTSFHPPFPSLRSLWLKFSVVSPVVVLSSSVVVVVAVGVVVCVVVVVVVGVVGVVSSVFVLLCSLFFVFLISSFCVRVVLVGSIFLGVVIVFLSWLVDVFLLLDITFSITFFLVWSSTSGFSVISIFSVLSVIFVVSLELRFFVLIAIIRVLSIRVILSCLLWLSGL